MHGAFDLPAHVFQGGKYFDRLADSAERLFEDHPRLAASLNSYVVVKDVGTKVKGIKNGSDDEQEKIRKVGTFIADKHYTTDSLRDAATKFGAAAANKYKELKHPNPDEVIALPEDEQAPPPAGADSGEAVVDALAERRKALPTLPKKGDE